MMDADNETVQMLMDMDMDVAELDQPHTFIPPRNEPAPLIHPLVERLEYKEAALEVLMQSIFEICNCDYLISTCATDSSDMRLNLSFANRLDTLATTLVGLSKNCKDAAKDIRDKVRDLEDRKIAAEGILEIAKRVENFQDKDPLVQTRREPPKPFTKTKDMKREPVDFLTISDSESDIEELTDWQIKQKENQPVFPEIQTQGSYTRSRIPTRGSTMIISVKYVVLHSDPRKTYATTKVSTQKNFILACSV